MNNLRSKLNQLGKDSLVYGLGKIFAKAIGLFLLPIYTRFFSPAEYGLIEMLVIINSFLGALLVMGMDSAQSFYFFEQKRGGKPSQSRVITGILQWRLIWGCLIIAIAILVSPLFNANFFNGQLSLIYFVISFIGVFFTQLMNQSVDVFRLLYRPWSYIGITLINTIISAGTTITLVILLNWGIMSYFVGFSASSVLTTIVGWISIRSYLDWSRLHSDWWPKLVRFGAPLVPAALAMYVLNTSDRWFLIHYHGNEILGIYSVGTKFAMLFALVVTIFRQAWWPIAMDAMHSPDGHEIFRTIGRFFLGVGSIIIVVLTAISPMLIKFLTAPAYHAAYPIIGVLSWHSLFYGFYLISAVGIWKKEKTTLVSISMVIAVLLNIMLDILLVPKFSYIGAAAATSISFFIWNVITTLISERLWHLQYPVGIFCLQIFIGVAAVAGILILYNRTDEIYKIGIIVIVIASLGLIAGLTLERVYIKWFFKKIINIIKATSVSLVITQIKR